VRKKSAAENKKIKNVAYPSNNRIMGSKKISMLRNVHVNVWRRQDSGPL
jgi:hypothetical protein